MVSLIIIRYLGQVFVNALPTFGDDLANRDDTVGDENDQSRQNSVWSSVAQGCRWAASNIACQFHDDVIKWKHFPCYWPFVRRIHRSPVNSHTKVSDAEL